MMCDVEGSAGSPHGGPADREAWRGRANERGTGRQLGVVSSSERRPHQKRRSVDPGRALQIAVGNGGAGFGRRHREDRAGNRSQWLRSESRGGRSMSDAMKSALRGARVVRDGRCAASPFWEPACFVRWSYADWRGRWSVAEARVERAFGSSRRRWEALRSLAGNSGRARCVVWVPSGAGGMRTSADGVSGAMWRSNEARSDTSWAHGTCV